MLFSFEPARGRRVRVAVLVGVLACFSALTVPASRARAFCRESTISSSSGPCVESPGVPLLHWTRSCMTYVFNDRLFERLRPLDEVEIRRIFNAAYQTWADVDCSGRSPFIADQAPGTTPTSTAEFVYDAENEAVVVARSDAEWKSLPKHDPTALAFTLLWHDTHTGEILDVDMELNTGAGKFANCDRGCTSMNMVDLSNTITHEAGHVLGLGHTTVRDATMTTTAIGAETEKRTLELDDKQGYCSLNLPEFECSSSCVCEPPPIYPSQRSVRTCACRSLGQAGSDSADAAPGVACLAMFAAGWGWRRQRRRTRQIRRAALTQ